MDFQKKSFIEPGESCLYWLKITLWKTSYLALSRNIGLLFEKKFSQFFVTFLDFISDMVVIHHRHFDI